MGGSEDNSTTFRAFVTPISAKGKFKFTLFDVSDEKGYCLNAPAIIPNSGEDSDAWKDLQFATQTGFTVSRSDNDVAETNANTLSDATVRITSYDYGSYGKIKVEFTPENGTDGCVGKEVGGTTQFDSYPRRYTDGNHALEMVHPKIQDQGRESQRERYRQSSPAGNGQNADEHYALRRV